jgi:hypothetical protein
MSIIKRFRESRTPNSGVNYGPFSRSGAESTSIRVEISVDRFAVSITDIPLKALAASM